MSTASLIHTAVFFTFYLIGQSIAGTLIVYLLWIAIVAVFTDHVDILTDSVSAFLSAIIAVWLSVRLLKVRNTINLDSNLGNRLYAASLASIVVILSLLQCQNRIHATQFPVGLVMSIVIFTGLSIVTYLYFVTSGFTQRIWPTSDLLEPILLFWVVSFWIFVITAAIFDWHRHATVLVSNAGIVLVALFARTRGFCFNEAVYIANEARRSKMDRKTK